MKLTETIFYRKLVIIVKHKSFVKISLFLSILIFFAWSGNVFAEVDYEKMPVTELQKKAEGGDSDAQYWLGRAYSDGRGIEKDDDKAFVWYQKSADQGNSYGMNALGVCYVQGDGVKKDGAKGIEFYKKAAAMGNSRAKANLSNHYFSGNLLDKDYQKGLELAKEAADKNEKIGQKNLGLAYLHGYGVEIDEEEAKAWFTKAAEQGNPVSQVELGYLFERPTNDESKLIDYSKAQYWYQKAIEQNYPTGYYLLGRMYLAGRGVEEDEKKALVLIGKAAEMGNRSAQMDMGRFFSKESSIGPFDEEKAIYWYEKAGTKEAYVKLAQLYRSPFSPHYSSEKAIEAYQKAVELGGSEEILSLGRYLHLLGRNEEALKWYHKAFEGDVKNTWITCEAAEICEKTGKIGEAFRWYLIGAELGDFKSMLKVALSYENGIGVSQDLAQAELWYKKIETKSNGTYVADLLYEAGDTKRAIGWYERMAFLGNTGAMLKLGHLYTNLEHPWKDESKGMEWYQKYVEKNLDYGYSQIALVYHKGDKKLRILPNPDRALFWDQKGADAGETGSQYSMGKSYYFGKGVPQDYEKAFAYYQKVAEKNPDWVAFEMGFFYLTGRGTRKDEKKAHEWFSRKKALYDLIQMGEIYREGILVEKELKKAFQYYSKAVEAGNPNGYFYLGRAYATGEGVSQNGKKALEWYGKSVKAGLAGRESIGDMYFYGQGVPKDYEKAIFWYSQEAQRGNARVQVKLGDLYWNGVEIPQNDQKAVRYYQQAAPYHSHAKYQLARAYELGRGIPKDIERAKQLYQMALASGVEEEKSDLERLR